MRLLMLLVLLLPVLSFGSLKEEFSDMLGRINAEIDRRKNNEILQVLAEQGVANAQHNLGVMYSKGYGVPEDDKEAVKWYRLAADQGDAKAQFNLGNMYRTGEGVPKDNLFAYMWANIAGANGLDVEELREFIAKEMSQADISKAQEKTTQYIKDHPDVY